MSAKSREARSFEISDAVAAYIAGAIDADGCICLSTDPRRPTQPRITSMFGIAQSVPSWLEDIQKDLGGNGVIGANSGGGTKGRICYVLRFSIAESLLILPKLLPFLRLKKRQAEIVLEFLGIPANPGQTLTCRSAQPRAKELLLEIRAIQGNMLWRQKKT